MLLSLRNINLRQLLRSPILIGILILLGITYLEFHHASMSDLFGQDQSLLTQLATVARPIPYLHYSDSPYGPYGLRDDFYFFPIPSADGKTLALVSHFRMHGRNVWPLHLGAEIYCRGNKDTEWSLAVVRRNQMDRDQHVLIMECEARGEFATLQIRQPDSGAKSIMIPLQSIRPRKLKAGAKGPHVVAMTMVGRWDIRLPAWIEYNLMRGAEEIYIYDNQRDGSDHTLRTALEPYIRAGKVVLVPWYHVLFDTWAPSWGDQQPLALNHVTASLDKYADWALLCDIDEFPMFTPLDQNRNITDFTYGGVLDAVLAARPDVRQVSMRNCFTSSVPHNPLPPGEVEPIPNADIAVAPPVTIPVPEPVGQIALLPETAYRFDQCSGYPYRSKTFIRPDMITISAVHVPGGGEGEAYHVEDPDTGLWLMHMSDHISEARGTQMTLDLSDISERTGRAVGSRYKA